MRGEYEGRASDPDKAGTRLFQIDIIHEKEKDTVDVLNSSKFFSAGVVGITEGGFVIGYFPTASQYMENFTESLISIYFDSYEETIKYVGRLLEIWEKNSTGPFINDKMGFEICFDAEARYPSPQFTNYSGERLNMKQEMEVYLLFSQFAESVYQVPVALLKDIAVEFDTGYS